jgi:hypothetical protein
MWEIINKNKKSFHPIPDNICASDFNLYFTRIAEKLVKTIPVQQPKTNFQNHLSHIVRPQDDFNFKEISYNAVRDAISNSKIIKTLVNVIYIPLTKNLYRGKCFFQRVENLES